MAFPVATYEAGAIVKCTYISIPQVGSGWLVLSSLDTMTTSIHLAKIYVDII